MEVDLALAHERQGNGQVMLILTACPPATRAGLERIVLDLRDRPIANIRLCLRGADPTGVTEQIPVDPEHRRHRIGTVLRRVQHLESLRRPATTAGGLGSLRRTSEWLDQQPFLAENASAVAGPINRDTVKTHFGAAGRTRPNGSSLSKYSLATDYGEMPEGTLGVLTVA
ncbi:hypothetical protein [Amycolatopsis alba]|uniref:hypothetical protein n=1 Tax=Amycolatopsis alba TaxID=76020 RepID=UPI00039FD421|nr:hypothetical protein [Amycolatopsis alba]